MKTFSLEFTRNEVSWLYRQITTERDAASKQSAELGNQHEDFDKVFGYSMELTKFIQTLKERLEQGTRDYLQLLQAKEELEEALILVGDDFEARNEVNYRLRELPDEEPYKVVFDDTTLQFTKNLLERDLQKFREHVIPSYNNKHTGEFKDKIQTKTYWINKAKKAMNILEELKVKMEKV